MRTSARSADIPPPACASARSASGTVLAADCLRPREGTSVSSGTSSRPRSGLDTKRIPYRLGRDVTRMVTVEVGTMATVDGIVLEPAGPGSVDRGPVRGQRQDRA